RATLAVSPGYAGPNRFVIRGDDASSRRAVAGDVALRFDMPSRPEVATSTLPLQRSADGTYSGVGPNLSLIGDWVVTAQLRRGDAVVVVPFKVTCGPSPEQLQQMTMGKVPMLYGIRLANGSQLEAYLSPGHPGRNTLHLVFTDQRNAPVSVPDVPTVTARQAGTDRTLRVLRL